MDEHCAIDASPTVFREGAMCSPEPCGRLSMKYFLCALFLCLLSIQGASAQSVSVDGYTRRDGTYVQPHHRSAPEGHFNNNWSTQPNVNPYTGQSGTHPPTWNDRPPSNNN